MQWFHGTPAVNPEVLPATEIDVLDIYSTATSARIPRTTKSLTEDLVLAGYLGMLPLHPELAISFKTLELFRCLKLFKPSFSTEAFTELICYLYYVGLCSHACLVTHSQAHRYLTAGIIAQLSWTHSTSTLSFSTTSNNRSSRHLDRALQIEGPRMPVRHVPTGYSCSDVVLPHHSDAHQVDGEEPPAFCLLCMDGNNSLKRVATSRGCGVADTCTYEDSDYFLSRVFVDSFADEVKT